MYTFFCEACKIKPFFRQNPPAPKKKIRMNPEFPVSEFNARRLVLRTIADAFGIRRELTHNPCAAPTSFLRAHLPLVQQGYVVTEKSDGVRYLLVFARLKQVYFACLVDRALAMFQVEVHAPKTMFDGSVFDCELVQSAKGPTLLVFDCLQLHAVSLRKQSFTKRYSKLGPNLEQLTCANLPVKIKSFVPLSDIANIKVDQLGHASDGFILQPANGRVVWGRDKRCFKWKYHPSIDVVIDGERVSCQEGPMPDDSDWVVIGKGLCNGLWECEATVATFDGRRRVALKPLRLRTDKLEANSRETIQGVVKEIEDSVQLWELSPAM
jgi:hypothetical protein